MPTLFEKLSTWPTAPDDDFHRFVVGPVDDHRTRLHNLVNELVRKEVQSQLQLIIGPNGNGKTLLNNVIKRAATDHNISVEGSERRVTQARFDVLFTHIDSRSTSTSKIGLELATSLKRSLFEKSVNTYALMCMAVFEQFAEIYRAPILLRFGTSFIKGLLTKALRHYEEFLPDLVTRSQDELQEALDASMDHVQRWIGSRLMSGAFRRFVQQKQLGTLLEDFQGGDSRTLTVADLNKSLRRDLQKLPLFEAVRFLADISSDVGCKLLILLIDDCDDEEILNALLPVVNKLSDFDNPRLLLVLTAVTSNWERIAENREDQTLVERYKEFGNMIEVTQPTVENLKTLAGRLIPIVNEHFEGTRGIVQPDGRKDNALARSCEGESYRVACHRILSELEKRLPPP